MRMYVSCHESVNCQPWCSSLQDQGKNSCWFWFSTILGWIVETPKLHDVKEALGGDGHTSSCLSVISRGCPKLNGNPTMSLSILVLVAPGPRRSVIKIWFCFATSPQFWLDPGAQEPRSTIINQKIHRRNRQVGRNAQSVRGYSQNVVSPKILSRNRQICLTRRVGCCCIYIMCKSDGPQTKTRAVPSNSVMILGTGAQFGNHYTTQQMLDALIRQRVITTLTWILQRESSKRADLKCTVSHWTSTMSSAASLAVSTYVIGRPTCYSLLKTQRKPNFETGEDPDKQSHTCTEEP